MNRSEYMTIVKNLNTVSCEMNEIIKEIFRVVDILNDMKIWISNQPIEKSDVIGQWEDNEKRI